MEKVALPVGDVARYSTMVSVGCREVGHISIKLNTSCMGGCDCVDIYGCVVAAGGRTYLGV